MSPTVNHEDQALKQTLGWPSGINWVLVGVGPRWVGPGPENKINVTLVPIHVASANKH